MARKPKKRPNSLCFHGAGKARIAEIRMMTASTPLQPRSIETMKLPLAFCISLPLEMVLPSKRWMTQAQMSASTEVNGTIT